MRSGSARWRRTSSAPPRRTPPTPRRGSRSCSTTAQSLGRWGCDSSCAHPSRRRGSQRQSSCGATASAPPTPGRSSRTWCGQPCRGSQRRSAARSTRSRRGSSPGHPSGKPRCCTPGRTRRRLSTRWDSCTRSCPPTADDAGPWRQRRWQRRWQWRRRRHSARKGVGTACTARTSSSSARCASWAWPSTPARPPRTCSAPPWRTGLASGRRTRSFYTATCSGGPACPAACTATSARGSPPSPSTR
mmetsp:Transcript_44371/g.143138  ORF Transcript_44371/g.143138 Transcript_44371/m.143138 type:complete len:245 (+) Transcript_44371:539-1273(+)